MLGFHLAEELLIPYRKVRYHLAEWGRANVRYVSIYDRHPYNYNNNDYYYYYYSPQTKKNYTISATHQLEML